MHVWNVLHAARWKYRKQNLRKKSPSADHRRTLSGYIFAPKACIDIVSDIAVFVLKRDVKLQPTRACIDNRKKNLFKQQYLLHMSSCLPCTNGWDRLAGLGHPSKFQQVSMSCLGFVILHRRCLTEVNQAARCLAGTLCTVSQKRPTYDLL